MLKVSENKNIEIKRKMSAIINLYFSCIKCGSGRFKTIHEGELSDLLKV